MSYRKRLSILIVIDSVIVFFSMYASSVFFPYELSGRLANMVLVSSILLCGLHLIFAYRFGLYRKVWEYASVAEVYTITKAVTFSVIGTAIIQYFLFQFISVKMLIVAWMINLLLIGGARFTWCIYRETFLKHEKGKVNTLIIGAGSGGSMVARQLLQGEESDLEPVAFLDDSDSKQKLEMYNIPIAGKVKDINRVVDLYNIQHIIIAIPSLTKAELNKIYDLCRQTTIKTQIMPSLEDIVEGKISISQLRDVSVEDLLGRDTVKLDDEGISKDIQGATILVTGAGGSIGSEVCRQVMKYKPSKLILLGHGENSIYTIEMELRTTYSETETTIVTEIADVQDRDKIFLVMKKHHPDIVYHAAAHKHVPLMERNPEEAVKNNVFGTKNVAEAADFAQVKTFVMISSDKAVNPTSVMGATKRIAEMVIQHLDHYSKTKFVAVRFGNVLGSRGSVIPLFKKQIEKGGPLTVTHPEMTRYFMTIPEASRLVIQASVLAKGGEIFVLDMGEPVKIVDLAKNLITLSGYNVDEIGIEYTGIRPGEKLYEELLGSQEVHEEQIYPKIYRGKATYLPNIMDIIHDELESNLYTLSSNQLRDYVLTIAKDSLKVAVSGTG
ncbi:MAG: polysaccharide biosynthesis protein [Bacillaceae bacterium]